MTPYDPVTPAYKDSDLEGTQISLDGLSVSARKIFVLNEGGMGSNNATLDFLRVSDGLYVNSAFRKMNPDAGAGLGDVGNDLAVIGNEVWIVVNNSGIVEVISARDEKEIAAVTVPTPRNIAFDDNYAYVTSWAGAYAIYGADYSVTDYKNPKGMVYRINLKTKELAGSVEVGYQPEGLVCSNGKLYVANSGGISSQLPPTYSYDNTVSIIDAGTFKVIKTVPVQVNLKNVYSDGAGNIYVTTLGNYYDVHSGLYMLSESNPDSPAHIGDLVSLSAVCGDTVYCIGTDSEFNWNIAHVYSGWKVRKGVKSNWNVSIDAATPYGLSVLDADSFLVSDAGNYFDPGYVSCYGKGGKLWTVTAGVCPGHFAIW